MPGKMYPLFLISACRISQPSMGLPRPCLPSIRIYSDRDGASQTEEVQSRNTCRGGALGVGTEVRLPRRDFLDWPCEAPRAAKLGQIYRKCQRWRRGRR